MTLIVFVSADGVVLFQGMLGQHLTLNYVMNFLLYNNHTTIGHNSSSVLLFGQSGWHMCLHVDAFCVYLRTV